MAKKKIKRTKNKDKKMDLLQQLVYILHLSQSFSKGYLPHKVGIMPRKALEIYSNDEKMRARAENKTPYQYVLHLEKYYTYCVNAEVYSSHKEYNTRKLKEALELKKEMENKSDI